MPSASRVNWAKFRVTVLTATALGILGVLAYLLSGATIFQDWFALHTYVPDAGGLARGTAVRMNGILVGKVTDVRLSHRRVPGQEVRVDMTIELPFMVQIPADSSTQLASENLLGDKYIDLNQGTSREHVRAGATLPFQPPSALVKNIDMQQFEAQLRSIDALLADIQAGRGRVGQFVRGEQMYSTLVAKISELEQSLRRATDTSSSLGQLLYSESSYEKIVAPLVKLNDQLQRLEAGQGTAGKLLKDSRQYDRIRDQVRDLNRAFADLNGGKGRAGRFLNNDRLYAKWTEKIESLIRSVDQFNYGEGGTAELFVSAQVYESLAGSAREIAANVRDFRSNPAKYLRIKLF